MLVHLSAILNSFQFNLFPSIIFLYTSHIHKLLRYLFGAKDYHSFSQQVNTGFRIPIQKVCHVSISYPSIFSSRTFSAQIAFLKINPLFNLLTIHFFKER